METNRTTENENMTTCSSCGNSVSINATTCPHCNKEITFGENENTVKCNACGKESVITEKYLIGK